MISGPLPAGLLMPAMAPEIRLAPSSMTPSSFLTLDVTGVPPGETPLCVPYNLTHSNRPSRMNVVNGGQPYELPVCEQYVEWTVTLSEQSACMMSVVCSPELQRPYSAHVDADAPLASDTGNLPTLRHRSASASQPGKAVAELSCSATCAESIAPEAAPDDLVDTLTVNAIMTPPAQDDLVAARSHATPDDVEADSPTSTLAPPVAPVPPPLLAAPSRRLTGVKNWASVVGSRRMLLPALVDLPPTEYRRHIGDLKAFEGSLRRLQESSTSAQVPVVKFVTVGVPPSADAGEALLTTMFSDVLTPADISAAVVDWQGGEAAVADATAAAAVSGVPGVQAGDSTDLPGVGFLGAAQGGSVTASDVPQQGSKDKNMVPRTAMIVIFTLVALLFFFVLLLGYWRWRTSVSSRFSEGDGKSSSYLSAGVPMIHEEGSVASDYSRITPASEEYTVTHLGSVSMSVNGVKDLAKDSSEQTLPGGRTSVAGNNSRRPLWMQLDTSGSVRSLMQSRNGRSKSRQNSDSGAATNSDALTRTTVVPGRSKYMAEFPKGSPVKALLRNQDAGGDVRDKLPPVSGSWNCDSELEAQRVRCVPSLDYSVN